MSTPKPVTPTSQSPLPTKVMKMPSLETLSANAFKIAQIECKKVEELCASESQCRQMFNEMAEHRVAEFIKIIKSTDSEVVKEQKMTQAINRHNETCNAIFTLVTRTDPLERDMFIGSFLQAYQSKELNKINEIESENIDIVKDFNLTPLNPAAVISAAPSAIVLPASPAPVQIDTTAEILAEVNRQADALIADSKRQLDAAKALTISDRTSILISETRELLTLMVDSGSLSLLPLQKQNEVNVKVTVPCERLELIAETVISIRKNFEKPKEKQGKEYANRLLTLDKLDAALENTMRRCRDNIGLDPENANLHIKNALTEMISHLKKAKGETTGFASTLAREIKRPLTLLEAELKQLTKSMAPPSVEKTTSFAEKVTSLFSRKN